ncbi:MAG: molybdopterin guanine dinucleotide-containing S/N-oxide reductase [Acuticoccus sp.]
MTRYTAAHWGVFEIAGTADAPELTPLAADPNPSQIGTTMLEACQRLRVERPAVRESVYREGPGANPERRGTERFVEVDWDVALDLAAKALRETIEAHGNRSIFGGSYGWASAGRFHHAQSQIHRFLNAVGGYVGHVNSYSIGAARVILPHVVESVDVLMKNHTSWEVLRDHTEVFVAFGGIPLKNSQVNPGGAMEHRVAGGVADMAARGTRFFNISPVRHDLAGVPGATWIPIRPGTDTALMLGLAHTILTKDLQDDAFLKSHCVGFERVRAYIDGTADGTAKSARWASAICGVPEATIVELAGLMATHRTMMNLAWALQRSHHGEQPCWMIITLAAMLGQIGLPGGGFGIGYGCGGMMGNANPLFRGPTLPQGRNAVGEVIPVARICDMLSAPGTPYDYNGARHVYPDIRLIYWAGGNPFHHHQDLARLVAAWRRVPHVLANEQFWTANAKMADIVLPATTTLERADIGYAARERYMVAMQPVIPPVGEARDDYAIFAGLAERLGAADTFTEGRSANEWLRHMYEESREGAVAAGVALPDWDAFQAAGLVDLAQPDQQVVMLEAFRRDPDAAPLKTPSGRLELFSETIDGFGYDDCPGHAAWLEPAEWLGACGPGDRRLHLLSDQPARKLHSQLDHSGHSRSNKVDGREALLIHPRDAAARGIAAGDLVLVRSPRGGVLAAARLSDGVVEGVVRMPTGAWFDPASWSDPTLDKHGNPNMVSLDIGASRLSQGCSAQTCLVEVQRVEGAGPSISAFDPPERVNADSLSPDRRLETLG